MTNQIIPLTLSQSLKETGIVKNFALCNDKGNKTLVVELNGKYDNRNAVADFHEGNWKSAIKDLRESLEYKNVQKEHITKILDTLDDNAFLIIAKLKEFREEEEKEDTGRQKESNRVLTTLAELGVISEVFKDQLGNAYATVAVENNIGNGEAGPLYHLETLAIDIGDKFQKWVCRTYYKEKFKTLGGETLTEVCRNLSSEAEFEGKERHLDVRVNRIEDDPLTFYYDLANPKWEVVKITPAGWSIENHSSDAVPTLFKRHKNNKPQVYPVKSGSYPADIFDQFFKLVNIKEDDENLKLLLKCYIVSLFIPDISKVILVLFGVKGAAKTAFEWMLKLLVDPSPGKSGKPALLSPPDKRESFVQQMSHHYLIYYDNVRYVKNWFSDALCRAATGTADSKRVLYTNDDDFYYEYTRCAGLNGIALTINQSDLLDRAILVGVERIGPERNRDFQSDIMVEFLKLRPQLLAYIFDILSKVLRMKAAGGITLDRKSRMADWEEHAEMIARCMGYEPMKFIKAYKANKELAANQALDTSPVATAVIAFMADKERWEGSVSELLAHLENMASVLFINVQRENRWPKAAHVLTVRLNEVRVDLAEMGIIITEKEHSGSTPKQIIIEAKVPKVPKTPKSADNGDNEGDDSDAESESEYP